MTDQDRAVSLAIELAVAVGRDDADAVAAIMNAAGADAVADAAVVLASWAAAVIHAGQEVPEARALRRLPTGVRAAAEPEDRVTT